MTDSQAEYLLKITVDNSELLKKLNESLTATKKFSQDAANSIMGTFNALKSVGKMAIFGEVATQIRDFVKEAARVTSVRDAYRDMAASFGTNGEVLLQAMTKASKGTIDDTELMQTAIKGMKFMGEDAIKNMPKLAEIALAAAKGSGKSVQEVYDQLVTGIGKGTPKALAQFFGKGNIQKDMEEYAKSLGVGVNELSAYGKQQALLNAVLKEGEYQIKRVGTSVDGISGKYQQLTVIQDSFKDGMIKGAEPAILSIMTSMVEAGQGAEQLGEKIGTVIGIFAMVAKAANDLNPLIAFTKLFTDALQFKNPFPAILDSVTSFGNFILTLTGDINILGIRLSALGDDAKKGFDLARDAIEKALKPSEAEQQKALVEWKGYEDKRKSAVDEINKYLTKSHKNRIEQELSDENDRYEKELALARQYSANLQTISDIEIKHFQNTQAIYEKTEEEMWNKIASKGLETVKQITSDLSTILSTVNDYQVNTFDNFVTRMDQSFEVAKELTLRAAGVADETEQQKNAKSIATLQKQIAKEHNLKKKKELQDQLNTKLAEKKKLDITQNYQLAQAVFDELMHIRKNALLKRQFESEKAMKLAQAGINMAAGVAAAWVSAMSMVFPPLVIIFGAIMTALVLAAGISSMATIASTQYVPLSQGVWNVPEDNYPALLHKDEKVLPRAFAKDYEDHMQGSPDSSEEIHVHLELDGDEIHRAVVKRDKKQQRLSSAKSRFSYQGAT